MTGPAVACSRGLVWLLVVTRTAAARIADRYTPDETLLAYSAEWVAGLDAGRDGGDRPGCGRPLSLFLFPVAESGHHVDAAASVAGGAGQYRQGRQAGVPEGVAGHAGP